MSILREDLPYTMTPVDVFEPSHQTGGMVTTYKDFIAWSVQH
jgi:hypothetical protein